MTCINSFSCYNIGMDEENKRLKEILKNCNTYNCMEEKSTNESKGIKVLGVDNFTAKGIKVI